MRTLLVLALLAAAAPAAETWRNPVDGAEFAWVPPGKMVIGCAPGEGCFAKIPARERVFADGFWMGRTEVTVGQFRRFVKATSYRTKAEEARDRRTWRAPGFAQKDSHPVVCLAIDDALAYARWAGVDLPTEAEWEYAARAGSPHRYYWGAEFDPRYAWHRPNSRGGTQPVARKLPNAYGLYDVSGNAWEWCKWEPEYGSSCEDGRGVPRGGSWVSCSPISLGQTHPTPSFKCFPSGVLAMDDDRGFRCIRRVSR